MRPLSGIWCAEADAKQCYWRAIFGFAGRTAGVASLEACSTKTGQKCPGFLASFAKNQLLAAENPDIVSGN